MKRLAAILATTVAGALAAPALAQDTSSPIALRARELLPILNGGGRPAAAFSRTFLAEVPEAKLREVAAAVTAELGKATGIASIERLDAQRARLVVAYEKGTARALLVLAPGASGRITGFVIDGIETADIAALRTLDDVAAAFAALPGQAGLAIAAASLNDLGLDEPALDDQARVAVAPDRPLAIASAHKLVILAELVRAIEAGERKWNDTVVLGGRELPAGRFSGSAPGTRVTLRELAEEMIRVSDNSATDVLLYALGRERIEAMQGSVGFRNPTANLPFLATMELFKLKGAQGGALGRRYLAADLAERRRLLANDVARESGSSVGALFADGRPVLIDRVEWFASPMDLVRAMGWFARHANTPPGAEALRILALNPGPAAAVRERFRYIGYKGGSEPGVLNMTVLVRGREGGWQVVAATWNDPGGGLEETRFQALVARALAIMADREA